jgi:hypothetical protein
MTHNYIDWEVEIIENIKNDLKNNEVLKNIF